MSSIDTRVDGSPQALLSAADFLTSTLATGATTMDDAVHAQRGQVAEAWEGDAAEGLRGRLGTLSAGAGTLSSAVTAAGLELETLGTVLEGVQADMESARNQAAAGGLTVSGTVIEGPGAPPPSVPALPVDHTPAERVAYDKGIAAIGAYNTARATWDTVVELVESAHERWTNAINTASSTWESNAGNLATVASSLLTAGASASAMAAIAYNARLMRGFHLESAAAYRAHVNAVTPGGRLTTTPGHYYDLLDSAAQHADDAARAGQTARGPRVPAGLGRGLFWLGVGATIYGYNEDVENGESEAQAAVSNGAGFAASLGAGALTGAAIGSVVPVGGTIVGAVAGTIVGAGVGIVTSGAVDSMWTNGVDGIEDVGNAIADGVEDLGQTISDTGSMIGDAAGAVGGTVKDAWNSIF